MYKIDVILNLPRYSVVSEILSYQYSENLALGTAVLLPIGKQQQLAVVVASQPLVEQPLEFKLRDIAQVLTNLAPLNPQWLKLTNFTARYYQRSWGEIALNALPAELKKTTNDKLGQRIKKLATKQASHNKTNASQDFSVLTNEQQQAVATIQGSLKPVLLFGVTGSGKTEVYLKLVEELLAKDNQAQALIMVPEINLTPQLCRRFSEYLAKLGWHQAVVSMHSGMSSVQRFNNWLLLHNKQARVLLGTRLTIFASLPNLKLIVVDEEHDCSYKQHEGARYSARDLAVYRHKLLIDESKAKNNSNLAQLVLGSATPSMETWYATQQGKYQLVELKSRIAAVKLPQIKLLDMRQQPADRVISSPLLEAIKQRVLAGQQVLLFLNRRGYSHIVCCPVCNWLANCHNCSVKLIYHKRDNSLRCHHCGSKQPLPQFCPDCASPLLEQVGVGTEYLEENLRQQLATLAKPDGSALNICRIDLDSTSKKGSLEQYLTAIHAGEVDVLIGTQMIAKGHDFRRVTLAAAINPDQLLFSANFRAPEQLFTLLEQVCGRAGRDGEFLRQHQQPAQMYIQTRYPQQPVFQALQRHDYVGFINNELKQRQQAMMPPVVFHALIRSDAKTQQQAQQFLINLKFALQNVASQYAVSIYDVVPTPIAKVSGVERAQLLVEAKQRSELHKFLFQVNSYIKQLPSSKIRRWFIDVDPLEV